MKEPNHYPYQFTWTRAGKIILIIAGLSGLLVGIAAIFHVI